MKKLHEKIQEKANYDPNEVNRNIQRQTRKLKYLTINKFKFGHVYSVNLIKGLSKGKKTTSMRKKWLTLKTK